MNPTVILIGATLVLTLWCIILTLMIAKEKQLFRDLIKGVTKKDLLSILKQITITLKDTTNNISELEKQISLIKSNNIKHLQKIGFIRFNPFSDTGGDQSFCLCLLDQDNNGIVITSLHSRDSTRMYAKNIFHSSTKDEALSEEETKAIESAVRS